MCLQGNFQLSAPLIYLLAMPLTYTVWAQFVWQLRVILKDERSHYVCPRTASQHKRRHKLKPPSIYRAVKEYN